MPAHAFILLLIYSFTFLPFFAFSIFFRSLILSSYFFGLFRFIWFFFLSLSSFFSLFFLFMLSLSLLALLYFSVSSFLYLNFIYCHIYPFLYFFLISLFSLSTLFFFYFSFISSSILFTSHFLTFSSSLSLCPSHPLLLCRLICLSSYLSSSSSSTMLFLILIPYPFFVPFPLFIRSSFLDSHLPLLLLISKYFFINSVLLSLFLPWLLVLSMFSHFPLLTSLHQPLFLSLFSLFPSFYLPFVCLYWSIKQLPFRLANVLISNKRFPEDKNFCSV